jgi:HAMP domain-containing protein
MKQPV